MVASTKDLGIVAGIGIIIYMISQAGKDVFGALPELDEGLRESISDISDSLSNTTKAISDVTGTVSDLQEGVGSFISEQQTNFDQFVIDSQTNLDNAGKGFTDFFTNLFNQNQIDTAKTQQDIFNSQLEEKQQQALDAGFSSIDEFEKGFDDPNDDPNKFRPDADQPQFTGKESDRDLFDAGLIDQFGRPIEQADQKTTSEPSGFVIPSDSLEVELPTDQTFQVFSAEGSTFVGGVIRENPVDTLNEVINLFPELSSSQAADFLNEFSGISPTDALRIDPDVSNIVANIDGQNIQVQDVSVSSLDAEEVKASCTTCELFGLNCEKCQIAGLSA